MKSSYSCKSTFIPVENGIRLHLLEAGEGPSLLMLPGGGFSNAIFKYQMDALSREFRVLALSPRSHGKSDQVDEGMCISRFAEDLKDVIDFLDLEEFSILAHSLGCSVVYKYMDLFSQKGIRRLILVDEPAVLTFHLEWTKEERLNYGATYSVSDKEALVNEMTEAHFGDMKKKIVDAMTTPHASEEVKSFILNCFEIPPNAARLLYSDNLAQDWRDVLLRIRVPTLCIGGRSSITPWQSQVWLGEQIPGASSIIFEEDQGGGHFMFVENPNAFNRLI